MGLEEEIGDEVGGVEEETGDEVAVQETGVELN